MAWNATLDIINSPNWKIAYERAREFSLRLRNETMKLYSQLRKQSVAKFDELRRRSLEMINRVRYHKTTLKYQKLTHDYYGHTLRLLHGRVNQVIHTQRQFKHRIHHTMNKITRLLNPLKWIPPFESKCILGQSTSFCFVIGLHDCQWSFFTLFMFKHMVVCLCLSLA